VGRAVSQVHGPTAREHPGINRTLELLDKRIPGHGITKSQIREFISSCPTCQKARLGHQVKGKPQSTTRVLATEHAHSAIGIDLLELNRDKNGNEYIDVIVNRTTQLVSLHPKGTKSAESTAVSLFKHLTRYGLVSEIWSDQGSDYTSKVIEQLEKWLGMRHRFAIVNRHQSSGVERTNREVLRHLRTLLIDERIKDDWSNPIVICIVEFLLNSHKSSETGFSPFDLTFGNLDEIYMQLPDNPDVTIFEPGLVKKINETLITLRAISKEFKEQLQRERQASNSSIPNTSYKPGDFVLKLKPEGSDKLDPQYLGPYQVVEQRNNDISIRHLNTGAISLEHIDDLKPFVGDYATAKALSLADFNQYVIKQIHSYRGDPSRRTSLDFEVEFEDGDVRWIPYSQDIFGSIPYEDFVRSRHFLTPLALTYAKAEELRKDVQSKGLDVEIGEIFYLDLLYYGASWYYALDLPNAESTRYMVEFRVTGILPDRKHAIVTVPLFGKKGIMHVSPWWLYLYAEPEIRAEDVLVDVLFARRYPQVLKG